MRGPSWKEYEHPRWTGETVFILGGGPSLRGFDAERLRGRRVIGVNEAGLTLCPWADVLFWADVRWVQWNAERFALHTGEFRYTCQSFGIDEIPRARLIGFKPASAFETDPTVLGGFDGGGRCINLAWHFGAARVVLLGFDMWDYPMDRWREGNWHEAHPEPPLVEQRAGEFVPAHARMAAAIDALGLKFRVVNATPDSALTCWKKVNLEDEIVR